MTIVPHRFDYILISHFILNLQAMSSALSHGVHLSQLSSLRPEPGQISSIRFATDIISGLGGLLPDGSHDSEEYEDDDNVNSDSGVEMDAR